MELRREEEKIRDHFVVKKEESASMNDLLYKQE